MNYIESFKWRYAAKKMNENVVPTDKLENILEAARLAPTSSGLQPFEVFVITNPEIKEKIRAVSWNQSVVTECSHLLVFAAWDTYTPERINEMFDLVNDVRGFKNDGWEKYREFLLLLIQLVMQKLISSMQLSKLTLHSDSRWQLPRWKKSTVLHWKVLIL